MNRKVVVILGCGVNALATAIRVMQIPERPYQVVIVSENFPPNTTSDVSGGIWMPFECEPIDKVNEWSRQTYPILWEIAQNNPQVCVIRDAYLLFTKLPSSEELNWTKFVVGFRELNEDEKRGAPFGFFFKTPNIISPKYLNWLMQEADKLGVQFFRYKITSLNELFTKWSKADIFINCMALGSRELFQDNDTFPIRGVLVQLKEKIRFNKFICWGDGPDGLTYIISREDKLLMGGTHDVNDGNLTVTPQELDDIYNKCIKMVPELKSAERVGYTVGLRPGRKSVRIELDTTHTKPIIHNYGHGGSGLTIHWGTADEVVGILTKYFPAHGVLHKL